MARLYVYTTLPLDTIVKLVHSHLPDSTPGIDSANKKLNSLLDKEPRWLHPRNESDMGRRVAQLSNSPARVAAADAAAYDRLLSDSDALRGSPVNIKQEATASPSQANKMLFAPDMAQSLGRSQPEDYPHRLRRSFTTPSSSTLATADPDDDNVFSPFLRRTSCLSTATDHTTGSFRQMLAGYSEPYIRTVKRLIKRFTAPFIDTSALSPIAEGPSTVHAWLDDADGPRAFTAEPHPLPDDFLNCDLYLENGICHCSPESHQSGRCWCSDHFGQYSSPWVNVNGMTPAGWQLLANGPSSSDVFECDVLGNTVLHFLAARGSTEMLLQVLETSLCNPVIGVRNTAGQTFLHVITARGGQNLSHIQQLVFISCPRGVDIYAQDVYGRSVFHILRAAGFPWDAARSTSPDLNNPCFHKRDAFGLVPTVSNAPDIHFDSMYPGFDAFADHSALNFGPSIGSTLETEARLLANVRVAFADPSMEDADGGNGLHCLALATLSSDSVMDRHCLDSVTPDRSAAKRQRMSRILDSSKARLEFRLSLVNGLLEAGVDPNHYDLRGNTPLMAFAAELPEDNDYKTGPKILEALVEGGASVHARNRAGETALHVAVRCGKKLAIRTLVQLGTSVHARDAEGRSVLDVADIRMMSCRAEDPRQYARHEACRAWLSSSKGLAVQRPSVLDEWRRRS
ncbi:hypothetical protein HIM_07490 [Hirsutella minnesotensis 3608]|uniref:Uncharacterized protein n=1 Tax=Hirsutella minnesotensis 3608 TaxID=1043627 RepID=A0A0F7ZHR6_9HYPO|nr:hypothetical protein HIM_07490 [Hirsutella minnesotensis 3608]